MSNFKWPSNQGISRAELEEEFFEDEQDESDDRVMLPLQQREADRESQMLDPLSSYNDPLMYYDDPYSASGYTDHSPGKSVAEMSASKSGGTHSGKYQTTGPKYQIRLGRGRSKASHSAQEGESQSAASISQLSQSYYVVSGSDMPSAAGHPTSWRNRPQPEAQGVTAAMAAASGGMSADSGTHSNKSNSINHRKETLPRTYIRAGSHGRSFSWPVLCCVLFAGPFLVLLAQNDDRNNTELLAAIPTATPVAMPSATPRTLAPTRVQASPSQSPVENIFQRSSLPTPLPSVYDSPTVPPTPLSNTVVELNVDKEDGSVQYWVHASDTSVLLSILLPFIFDDDNSTDIANVVLAVYPGTYLALGEDCGNTTQTQTLPASPTNSSNTNESANTTASEGPLEIELNLTDTMDTTLALCVNNTVYSASYHFFLNLTDSQMVGVNEQQSM